MSVIALSGASSTGKSTLLSDLRKPITELAEEHNREVVFQKERAREIFEEQFSHSYESLTDLLADDPLVYQMALAEAFQADALVAKTNPKTLYVADRTGFDVAVYTMLLGGTGYSDAAKINGIFAMLHSSLHVVDHVFLTVPFNVEAEQDGFRPDQYADPAKRALEVNMFRHIGATFSNTTILPSSHAERIETVLDLLKRRLSNNTI
ncbi:ATP-binding protein (plasmid) [Trichlorobacter lovleyi]|uniref:ATP/GTP-binding protein n=1 Tax=Trichlorobacter lovleyi TaxID=313985 RepID=UPI0022404555|nr:ATP-binding protein [Trichlorobacter lovleyi]QOX80908.1 ATP-binding protein [Trichlorobacter lovleyi]